MRVLKGKFMRIVRSLWIALFIAMIPLSWEGCTERGSANQQDTRPLTAKVTADGKTITFPDGCPGLQQISSQIVKRQTAIVSVLAPSRVVASILSVGPSSDRAILFDSPDVTSLYSQYRQARTNMQKTELNLRRVNEMFATQGATARDVTEAQTDAANARASMAEVEAKLMALGFNPGDLDKAAPGTVWIISDVNDTQLGDVQKGEDVDIYFNAFPDKKYAGRAVAIGGVLDPATRTIKVRVEARNPAGLFLPGMFARVDYGDPVDNVIVIPTSAIVTVEGTDYVFVETVPHVFERRAINTRYPSDKSVVVLKGVNEGDHVVVSGAMLLKGLSFGY